ncbi:expressed unknown protein [Ectocarpus siliculosus]|uniref:Uncharacterized protein n=1 Tax=Ectocarpus siliculosus TaxID=2880 RepID=D8LTF5_ECTSI|nr:expressed unknown protein [Ectocarpus siliculosus]|eukprot:CBN78065.1 expressed unknown protein [Ectocarpus siliculosus]
MRPLHVLELLHVLGFLTILGGADGFVFGAASAKPGVLRLGAARTNDGDSSKSGGAKARDLAVASRHSRSPPAQPLQQTPWLADIMASWFNLPLRNTSPSGGTKRRSTRDDIRADILKLRVSNADLREEVLALRNSMVQRGFFPVDDVFATATATATGGTPASGNGQQPPTSEGGDPKPPAKLQREARLAALVVLWGAAVALGGVFVPIAIGVGAARSLRWLDNGGTLVPKRWSRPLGRGWRRARALSFVPVLARPPRDGGGGGEGLVTGEALADAWDEMYPPRQR